MPPGSYHCIQAVWARSIIDVSISWELVVICYDKDLKWSQQKVINQCNNIHLAPLKVSSKEQKSWSFRNHENLWSCDKTISVIMKDRQNHRKRKNVKIQFFQMRDIIFLLGLSCCLMQHLPYSNGFKGLMPFPEGKKWFFSPNINSHG